MAAYLALKGYETALYTHDPVKAGQLAGPFTLTGCLQGTATPGLVSTDIGAVIAGAPLVMVTTPAQNHPAIAAALAPWLADGQSVVLNPGRTMGTYAFTQALAQAGCRARIVVGETDTFMFTCRAPQPGRPMLNGIKAVVAVAAHNPADTHGLVTLMQEPFPNVIAAPGVAHTGLSNVGMIFHPLPTLLNMARIEQGQPYQHYLDGITPRIADLLMKADGERLAVAAALGVTVPSAPQWLQMTYGVEGEGLYGLLQANKAYRGIMGPHDLSTRYIYEDVPTGCVPVSALGDRLGVETPMLDAVITMADTLAGCDFMATGRGPAMVATAMADGFGTA